MIAEDREKLKSEVVALYADVEALIRDAGEALKRGDAARHELRRAGVDPGHFGMALGDVAIAHQIRGALRSNGFSAVLDAPPYHGIEAQPDLAGHVAGCVRYLPLRVKPESPAQFTVGQTPVDPKPNGDAPVTYSTIQMPPKGDIDPGVL